MVSTMKTLLLVPWADCLILSQISVISLRAVSAPIEKSVPGTLLEMVAGSTTMGILNSLKVSLCSAICRTAWKASKPPMTTSP